jgi:hypothetical protein
LVIIEASELVKTEINLSFITNYFVGTVAFVNAAMKHLHFTKFTITNHLEMSEASFKTVIAVVGIII